MKKLVKILIGFVLVLVAAVAVAFVVIQSVFPPEKIQKLVETQLTQALGRPTTVGGAHVSLWPLGVKIKDVQVANHSGAGFSETPLLSLPLAVVAVDLVQLVQLRVAIDEIALVDLALNYEVLPDGRTSIDGLGGASDSAVADTLAPLDLSQIELPGSLQLKAFRIENAQVVFNDRASKRKIVLGRIDQTIGLDLDRTLENIQTKGQLLIQEISVEDAGLGVRKGNVQISLQHDLFANLRTQFVQINDVSVGVQSIRVTAKGSVSRFLEDIKVVDLQVASNDMQLADLLKEVPAGINPEISKVRASGSAQFQVAVKGAVVAGKLPALNGAITLANLALAHQDLPAGISALNGKIEFSESALRMNPLSLQLANQPVQVVLEADQLLSDKPLLKQLQVNANLDLGALFALASKIAPIPEGTDLKGFLMANVKAHGVLDPSKPEGLQVQGGAELKNIVAQVQEIPDALTLNGQVNFSNTAITTTQAAKIGPSDVTIDVKIRDYLAMVQPRLAKGKRLTAEVNVTSANLEIDRLLPPTSGEKVEEESIPMELWPELPDVVAQVNVNLARTVFRFMTLSDFKMVLRLANQKLNVNAGGRLYDGSFATDVAVDLKDRQSAVVALNMNLRDVQANDFITHGNDNVQGETVLAKQIRGLDNTVYGKLKLQMDLNTRGLPQTFVNHLNGPISVQLNQGKIVGSNVAGAIVGGVSDFEIAGRKVLKDVVKVDLNDLTFKDLHADFEARNGELLVKDWTMDAGGLGALALSGSVGLDGLLNLGVQNTLTASMTQKLESLVGGAQKALAGAASKALGGIGAGVASSVASASLYPKDASGNALLFLGLGGSLQNPKAQIDRPKMASALKSSSQNAVASPAADLKANLKASATAKIDDAKAKAQQALDAQKAKLEAQKAELAAQAEAKKKELEAQAAAKKKDVKQKTTTKAKDALKEGLKGFGR